MTVGIDTFREQPPFLPGVQWREFISRDPIHTPEGSWGYDASQEVLVLDIPFELEEAAIQGVLGYPRRDNTGSTPRLNRTLPMRHPRYDWLYATKVGTVKRCVFNGKLSNGVSGYLFSRFTVLFASLPYDVLTDGQIQSSFGGSEFARFVEKLHQPAGEFITREQGSFKWAETGTDGPTVGQDFNGFTSQFLAKADLIWRWHQVPHNWIYNAAGVDANIENGVGKVNDATFAGRAAGTLLMLPPKITPGYAPVDPILLGLNPQTQPPRVYTVEFPVKFFDPPTNATTRGHNTAPFAGNNKWYLVKSKPAMMAAEAPLHESYDFNKFFQGV